MTASANAPERREQRFNFPLPLWMILAALAIGLVGRLDAPTLVASFNSGYGAALGEFALILIPSFVLAACLSHRSAGSAAGAATVASPFMAAGMICPDTSYAALAPVAGHRKLSVALAGYAGFKLLFPAGPLIVATGLGVDSPYLFVVARPGCSASCGFDTGPACVPCPSSSRALRPGAWCARSCLSAAWPCCS